ncbi:acetyl-CoA carboxylase biotin carboxyl carrier protein [[Clostridium] colinum]|uniref:acetyl-CoA carboxylase biotin carboxyl carrier protein n=1 Tax=[Clostridium] colinum TaxID=36835 RepID=UPI002023D0B7|nr:acetyl-CoA carboxylase biotin carboxyl carrier protein [[Clostridium] colinum]
MDFEKIKDLMQSLDNSNLMDFELKLNEGFYLRMNKYNSQPTTQNINISEQPNNTQLPTINNIAENISEPITIIPEAKQEIKEGNVITSPIVGTFYSSSSPTKPAYVKVGDKVKKGDVLCIIEAMKVMNEIKSQYDGEIVEIMVENEAMVEYNQPLFRIV